MNADLSENNAKTGIGADTNLCTQRDIRRVQTTLRTFRQYTKNLSLSEPWLDVGAGVSYMREQLRQIYKTNVFTYEIDLDWGKYPVADGYFKMITSFEVLEHLFNPLFHLTELRRVLADDGNMFLTTPNDYGLIYKTEHLLSRKYRPHFHQFCERDLRDIVNKAGLKIITLKKCFHSRSGTIARISKNDFFMHCNKIT